MTTKQSELTTAKRPPFPPPPPPPPPATTPTTLKGGTRAVLLAISVTLGMAAPLMPLVVTQYMQTERMPVNGVLVAGLFVVHHATTLMTSLLMTPGQSQSCLLVLLAQAVSFGMFGLISLIENNTIFLFAAYFQRICEAVAASLVNGCVQAVLAGQNARVRSSYDGSFACGTFIGPFVLAALYKQSSLLAVYVFLGALQLALCASLALVSRCRNVLAPLPLNSGELAQAAAVATTATATGGGDGGSSLVREYAVLHSAAFWIVLIPVVATNMAVSLADLAMGNVLGSMRMHWAIEAVPFFCANLAFFVTLSTMIACSEKIETIRQPIMFLAMFLSGSGCAISGYWTTYFHCCIGMFMIGGSFAMALVCVTVSTIGIGLKMGIPETQVLTSAPNIVDSANVLSKLPCFIVASLLIHQHDYQWCSIIFASLIFLMTLLFLISYSPAIISWISFTDLKRANPKDDLRGVDNIAYQVSFK